MNEIRSSDVFSITQTMRKLIFRLNLQQYRNNKYKKKEHPPATRAPEIIDLDAEGSPTDLPTKNAVPITIASTENDTHLPNTYSSKGLAGQELPHLQYNVYDVPPSPDHEPEPRPTKRKPKALRQPQPAKRSKIVTLKVPSSRTSVADSGQATEKITRTSQRARKTRQREDYAGLNDLNQAIASQTTTDEPPLHRDNDIGPGHQTYTRQSCGSVERALNHIRTVQPSVTSEPPTPSIGQTKSTPDSHIDPNLERFVLPSSTIHQSQPSHTSSTAPIMSSVQTGVQSSLSPTPTMSAFASVRETTQQTSVTLQHSTPDVQSTQGQKSASVASEIPAPATSTAPKPIVDFNYIVILSHAPIYSWKAWNPKGHFMEKSLQELVRELPFDSKKDIRGLTIRLKGPGVVGEETVDCGEEEKFENAKGRFLRTVKMCIKNHNKANAGNKLSLEFEIEAVREGGVEEEDDEDDDNFVF
ncbi:hypothetical protein N0V90_001392 [Kalmusia sp. IMI 367209]|nr:hypothetical protein N0V90_001392 [Kalmusia sp. IMI 367209]